jgi:hypothetical protein
VPYAVPPDAQAPDKEERSDERREPRADSKLLGQPRLNDDLQELAVDGFDRPLQ